MQLHRAPAIPDESWADIALVGALRREQARAYARFTSAYLAVGRKRRHG
jgi:hypothetical protein